LNQAAFDDSGHGDGLPAGDEDLAVGEKVEGFASMGLEIAKK
jgi:hypothetical protein